MSEDLRARIVEVCHLLSARNFTTAFGGNVSVRLPDGGCWITPSRLHKARVQPDDLVRVDAQGMKVAGAREASSEKLLHLALYRALPQAGAIIHAHPPCATGFAQARQAIETTASSEAYVILGPRVPLLPYERTSTPALAARVAEAVTPRTPAYLLANHGALTWGPDLWEAYDLLDTLELSAQSLLVARLLGGAVALPPEELAWLDGKTG